MENRRQYINMIIPDDFDFIDAKEFKKYLAIKKYEI